MPYGQVLALKESVLYHTKKLISTYKDCIMEYILIILTGCFILAGHLTEKSDVYSFGVVLLEMLSGRRAVDKNRPSGEHNLVEWARPYLTNKRKVFRVLDRRLEGQYSLEGAQKVASLSFQCLSSEGMLRPSMEDVVAVLEQLQKKNDSDKKSEEEQKMDAQSFGSGSEKPSLRSLEESGSEKAA